jgi:probable rRNA maturation factor
MRVRLDIENAAKSARTPPQSELARWARAALKGMRRARIAVSLRLVDEFESAELNKRYRRKKGPTNVLSFRFENPPGARSDLLGDVVICAPVVNREATDPVRSGRAHWAHVVVHGIMHLRGFDHENHKDAAVMEGKEAKILKRLGFRNPYA